MSTHSIWTDEEIIEADNTFGTLKEAAEYLGMSLSGFHKRVQQLGI